MEQGRKDFGWMRLVLAAAACLACINCAGAGRTGERNLDLRLIRAAEAGKTEEVRRLILRGADINAMDRDGWTPYLAASSNGRLESMRLLKALGARTDTYLEKGALAIR